MKNRSLAAVGCALILGSGLTACANLPTSGTVQVSSLQGSGLQAQTGVQIVPVPPGQNWTPAEIVSGFLAASATFHKHHAVAREYLTAGPHGYAKKWRPGWAATLIDSPSVNLEPNGRVETGGPPSARVDVTGQHLATLQTTGRYQAGSVVVSPASTVYTFSLVQVSGQWRIDDLFINKKLAPPTVLLLTRSDFERDYQPRDVYFLPAASAVNALVPDPVFIPQDAGMLQSVRGLVRTLLHQPSANSWLYGAARTAFPPGTTPISVQVTGGIKVVVNLGGNAAKASPGQRRQMAAQLYWTLHGSPFGTQAASQIRSVVLEINHHPQPLPPKSSGWVPRGPGAPLYYQVPGGPDEPALAVLHASASGSGSVPLPKGLANEPFSTIAVSTALAGSAVVAGCNGKYVYLLPQSHSGQVVKTRLLTNCTSLSWDDRANLWVTAKAGVFVIPHAGIGPPLRPELVTVEIPPLSPTAVVQSLQVAPDGVRVAMIVHTGSATRILIAAISRNPTFTYLAQTGRGAPGHDQMLRVGSDITDPVALTWLDPDHLLVLNRSVPARSEIFEVPLTGGDSTEIATPPGVTSLAASWPNGQDLPHIVVAVAPTATTPGKIEIARNGLPNPDWLQLVKGITPVFPG